jgi:hypothetical protein
MKDPAFLFYSSDFLTGVMFMTNEEVGIYIRLLCVQHQKGYASLFEIKAVASGCDVSNILSKFKSRHIDGIGTVYFNERLEDETERRVKYAESRRQNRLGKPSSKISVSYVAHKENENENENENIIEDKNELQIISKASKSTPKDVSEVSLYFRSLIPETIADNEANKFFDYYSSNGWKVSGKSPMKDWRAAARNWVRNSNSLTIKSNSNGNTHIKVGRFDGNAAEQVLRDLNKLT